MKRSFICRKCGKAVTYSAPGTHNRNHCPFCLYSLHVDNIIGDRGSNCGGLMGPIGKLLKDNGEEVLVHKCLNCGEVRKNRVAGDDSIELVNNLSVITL